MKIETHRQSGKPKNQFNSQAKAGKMSGLPEPLEPVVAPLEFPSFGSFLLLFKLVFFPYPH